MVSELQDQAIRQHCKTLRMPTIGGQFARLAEAATREGQSHVGYLEALLAAEMEERESRAITRLLHEAHVVTVPGEAFGTAEHIRMSYPVTRQNIDEGVRRMAEFLAPLR